MIKTSQPFPAGAFEATDKVLAMLARLAPDAFVELPRFDELRDGAAVEQDSRTWAARFFRAGANPYEATPAPRRTAHVASADSADLLRHELGLGELGLTITESVRWVLVSIHAPNLPELGANDHATAQAIADLGEQVLLMAGTHRDPFGQVANYQWTLQYQAPLREGSRFTTIPLAEPRLLRSYAERLDGGIERGLPFFLGYKARPSGDGRLVFLDARHWFDGECWEPYERSPRR
jgi:hypothetical protein